MSKGAIKLIKFMTRHGLDARVLQEYTQCGMIYCSKRYNLNSADLHRFVDFEGYDRKIIDTIDAYEILYNVSVFHIIQNDNNTFILMCYDDELDEEYQFNKFRSGTCTAIKYSADTDECIYTEVKFGVRLGAVIDVDFNFNM